MKKISFLFFFTCAFFFAQAQILEPVKWQASYTKTAQNEYNLVFRASIDEGWHVYSNDIPEGGPVATTITFEENEAFQLDGGLTATTAPISVDDKIFGMTLSYFEDSLVFVQKIKSNAKSLSVKGYVEFMCCDDGRCLPPSAFDFDIKIGDAPVVDEAPAETGDSTSIWPLIIQAILWGFAALLTPCVFPMVPMTVSFFLKGSGNKAYGRFRAFMYFLFIVLLYTVPIAVIIITTWIFGGDSVTASIFNWLSTHWIPNIIFFIVFMVFAASFFGAFEIVMPEKLVNGSDKKSDKKGLGGVFFMALTLVLVSFACTGPIVGTVLIKSTSGEFWAPIVTMFAFSVAFALPFALFAFFPALLKNMPKNGGWLNSVKVVLGFIEVALGFKFLSVADQTYHWGILDREVYLAIWIVCFTLLGFYLLGKIKFKNDDDVPHISVLRLVLSIVVFSFVVYMIPGMWGAPLKSLSGYLPPQQTMDFDLTRHQVVYQTGHSDAKPTTALYSEFLELPHGLQGYFDFDEAATHAKEEGKPIFIDFTGHGCVNCRSMEAQVWSDPRVQQILTEDYIIVALYVDDKSPLSKNDAKYGMYKSIGAKNADFQIKNFNANAQPYYCLVGHDGNLLATPRAYDLDVEAFIAFLESGKAAFAK